MDNLFCFPEALVAKEIVCVLVRRLPNLVLNEDIILSLSIILLARSWQILLEIPDG